MAYLTDRKRAEGLGSAHSGTEHFINQRITAALLVPLIILFLIFVAPLIGAPIEEVRAGFKSYWVSLIAAATTVTAGIHIVQGMQVVVEDYVGHKGMRIWSVFKLKAGIGVLVIAALWAIAMLSFA